MVRKIINDIAFLKKKAIAASDADAGTAVDLRDTLEANKERCVGLAANMIGARCRMIIVSTPLAPIVMCNPKIVSHSAGSYEAEEGCLSLKGTRKTRRWVEIKVEYSDPDGGKHISDFSGFTAQIIQHEIDHCNGIII